MVAINNTLVSELQQHQHFCLRQTDGCFSVEERKKKKKKLSHPDHQPLSVNKQCFLTALHLMWDSSPTFSQQAQSHVGNYMIHEGRQKQSQAEQEEERKTRLFSSFSWTASFLLTHPANSKCINLVSLNWAMSLSLLTEAWPHSSQISFSLRHTQFVTTPSMIIIITQIKSKINVIYWSKLEFNFSSRDTLALTHSPRSAYQHMMHKLGFCKHGGQQVVQLWYERAHLQSTGAKVSGSRAQQGWGRTE